MNGGATWRTSSYSGSNGGNCVEVAARDHVVVRDTKDRTGAVLAFGEATWREFTARIKRNSD
jgi:hypothetical protein